MTVQRVSFQQNVGNVYTAEEMRRVLKFLANRRSGVNAVGDLAVTQNGTPNMSINVAAGEALELGSETTTQGIYYAYNDAVLNRTIAASDPTNPRNDLVVVRVRDQFYSGTFNDGDVFVVPGTPAPAPVDPTPPANYETLARVRVNANATTITNANITDLRVWQAQKLYPGPKGLHVRDSTDARDNLYVDDNGFLFPQGAISVPPSFGGTLPASSYGTVPVKIDEQVVGPGGAASVRFPASGSLPTGFRHLLLMYHARSDAAGQFYVDLLMQFNGDTGANYGIVATVNTGAAISASAVGPATSASVGVISAASRSATGAGAGRIDIPDYRSTVWNKKIISQSHEGGAAAAAINARNHWGVWEPAVSAAITSILLQASTGLLVTGSQFTLYGVP